MSNKMWGGPVTERHRCDHTGINVPSTSIVTSYAQDIRRVQAHGPRRCRARHYNGAKRCGKKYSEGSRHDVVRIGTGGSFDSARARGHYTMNVGEQARHELIGPARGDATPRVSSNDKVAPITALCPRHDRRDRLRLLALSQRAMGDRDWENETGIKR